MKSIETRAVSIPITQSISERKFIRGALYGSGKTAIIFSNMDTNDQTEWEPIIEGMVSDNHMMLTYEYGEHLDDQSGILEDVISFVCELGAVKVALVGASRGGVASIKAAARQMDSDVVVGVAAISAPIEHEGTVFYSSDELRGIKIPKLLINSENDDGANDNRKMCDIFSEPKELHFFPGDAHGTELFDKERESIIKKLRHFARLVLGES